MQWNKSRAVGLWQRLESVRSLRDFVVVVGSPVTWFQKEDLRSRLESTRFILSLRPRVRRFLFMREIRDWAIDLAPSDGLFLEFGVADGSSTRDLSVALRRRGIRSPLYGFDWFRGLPSRWRDGVEQGAFKQRALPEVDPNVRLIVGLFEETLAGFLAEHPEPAGFVHLDCDLYASAAYVLSTLRAAGRLVPGTIVLFDELFNYRGWYRTGEFRALREAFPSGGLDFEVLAVIPRDQQVLVRLVRANGPAPDARATAS